MRTEIYWIPLDSPGRLAIFPRPRQGDWLEDEISAYQQAGIDVLISLLEEEEIEELGLQDEAELAQAAELRFINFPIRDRDVPKIDDWTGAFIAQAHKALLQGASVGIHCRMGIGRSGMIAAILMVLSGSSADDAFSAITSARGLEVPDTDAQRDFVDTAARLWADLE